jgi:serine/threonine protein kinase
MTPERWQQVKEIFDRAVERDPASRIPFIRECCGDDDELRKEVESLLASDTETSSLLDGPAIALKAAVAPPKPDGTRIGPYEILRELGKGGMGVVYLARRTDGVYPKLVALKVLRSGSASPDILHRFDQECRILASLNHPNIARFFDGGKTAEGLPYYVMEFIDGQPIDRHCDLQRLDLRSRLALFQQVCDAVNCAHRSGIVHRDLKPSNILVTPEGIVKLLDFGIAKLLQADPGGATVWLTDSGLRPMTPEYASPEQIQEQELTRATDVYSLGVVVYEILTGRRPYRLRSRMFHEILRVVCEEQPTLPSIAANLSADSPGGSPTTDSDTIARQRQTTPGDLRKQLSGDLDSIVMKALRKEPWQRYASAAQFGEDVRRHLEGSPVEARSGRYYRFGKRLNQNRGWLVLVIALIAAVATRSIHVTWPAVWIGTAALGMFAIWQIGGNRDLARKIAGGPIWAILRVILIAALVVSVVGPRFVHEGSLVAYFVPDSFIVNFNPHRYDVVKLFWTVPIGALFLRWVMRRRLGGSLVLESPSQRSSWPVRCAGLSVSIEALFWRTSTGNAAAEFFLNLVLSMLWLFIFALSGRLDLRQFGLMTATGFYRWPNIESYSWIEAAGRKDAVLTLKLHGRHPLLPSPKIKVPLAKKPEVEAVMARYLSEWPGNTGK